MTWWKWVLVVSGVLAALAGAVFYFLWAHADFDPYVPLYKANCGGCHGDDLRGTASVRALIDRRLEHGGTAFPGWHGNLLLGSLKGSSLYRMVFEGNRLVHRETLISNLARIRDIEVGYDGLVYLLLENREGSRIVRLRPTDKGAGQPSVVRS